ncbi:Leucine-Rich Repeat Serine/Threonine-Protein Kinase 1 [Manis pentadactyla]|nr:Leucine-Rich Repeat Serine/Threonine-Protein Kinase 1 [Manis pentadactyla]
MGVHARENQGQAMEPLDGLGGWLRVGSPSVTRHMRTHLSSDLQVGLGRCDHTSVLTSAHRHIPGPASAQAGNWVSFDSLALSCSPQQLNPVALSRLWRGGDEGDGLVALRSLSRPPFVSNYSDGGFNRRTYFLGPSYF